MKTVNILILAIFLLLAGANASAQRVRLSDALSPQQNYSLDLAWQSHELTPMVTAILNGNESALPPLMGIVPGVEIRLPRLHGQARLKPDANSALRAPTFQVHPAGQTGGAVR